MTTSTLPRHAATAVRVRKPNRRKGSIVTAFRRALLVFLAAFFLGALFPQLGAAAAHAAARNGSPAQDQAACAAVYHYHHALAAGWASGTWGQQEAFQGAWHHAWHAARSADHGMHADIDRFLNRTKGWSLVRNDCQPGEGL